MQVVLKKDYPKLGQKGDVFNVKPGYYRNFLMPNDIVKIATEADMTRHEEMAKEREAKRKAMMAQAASLVVDLDGQTVQIAAKASDGGSLYANVHESDVAQLLNDKFSAHLAARDIKFAEPVKKVGPHSVMVVVSPEHKATLTLNVVAEA